MGGVEAGRHIAFHLGSVSPAAPASQAMPGFFVLRPSIALGN